MKKLNLVLLISSALLVFISCKKDEVFSQLTYNEKANKLILQIAKDESCGCILEMPEKSMIKIRTQENPGIDAGIKSFILKKLHLKNIKQLDSLEKVSEKFILDTVSFKQKNIKIIKPNLVFSHNKNVDLILSKKCSDGIFLYFSKPIIDEKNKKAALFYTPMFTCLSSPLYVYKFEDGKWLNNEN